MYELKYEKIPEKWINGLPVGNGRLAAMYWGDEKQDIFSLNHESLWRGKYRGKEPEYAADKLPLLRKLLKEKDYFKATVFANLFFGGNGGDSGNGPGRIDKFQPAGNLVFEYENAEKNNTSMLDITTGLICAKRNDAVTVSAFCDSNDGTVMAKWESNEKFGGKLSFLRTNDPEAKYTVNASESEICFECEFICGISYRAIVKIDTDGKKCVSGNAVCIENATRIVCEMNIILSNEDIRESNMNFEAVYEKHAEKFKSYMERVSFSVEALDVNLPTNERIKKIREGVSDTKLQELYFHYGRYLMTSSCICGKLPPNLQGKWNEEIMPPWCSDYHLDINLQMNEWMIEAANFSEFADPLADFLLSTIEGGRKAAKNLYGCSGIWLSHAADIWGEPTPESFGYAVWTGSAAWMAQPLWQHYLYTGDKEFLKNKAYPFIKEVALFYEDFLEKDENGVYQIMPSQSPENRFVGAGSVATVGICSSSAIDVQLTYDALGYAIQCAQILGVDAQEAKKWEKLRKNLPPFAIGSDGRLLEWNEEFEEEQPGHKHLSHLYGLFPSDIFTPEGRKAEYDAAVKSFKYRLSHESGYTGWSRAWIANICARTGDSKEFYKQIEGLLRDFATESLLDIHPDPLNPRVGPDIFQIDGNFGMVSAVTEALCGYFDNKAHFLHALPTEWKTGNISGIKLPGGHTVSFEWENSKLIKLEIIMGFSEKLVTVINGKEITFEGECGEKITFEKGQ